MNFIQRAWLIVLKPVTTLVNDKLAKRSGILGRIGRFYAFGPRQFGYHPINRWMAYMNQVIVLNMGLLLHRYSFFKGLTQNGFNFFRSHKFTSLLGPFVIFFNLIYLTLPQGASLEDGTSLYHLQSKLTKAPVNALNHRTSAHFTQINSMYSHEMMKKFITLAENTCKERQNQDEETKRTKYARPGYKYIKAHSNVIDN